MKPDDGYFRCPCCKACNDCEAGFQKILDLKNTGLVIYLHTTNNEANNYYTGLQFTAKTIEDVFILHNTKNIDITSADYLPEIEINAIPCPRCRKIAENAQKLLEKVPTINRNDVKGICEHCRMKATPCVQCKEVVKKFVTNKTERTENTKEKVKQWLSKVKGLLKDSLSDMGSEKVRARSELHIDELCRDVPKSREPEVKQMFHDTSDVDGAVSPSIKNRKTMFANVPPSGKPKRPVAFIDQPEILDIPSTSRLNPEINVQDSEGYYSDVDSEEMRSMFHPALTEERRQRRSNKEHIPTVTFLKMSQSEEDFTTGQDDDVTSLGLRINSPKSYKSREDPDIAKKSLIQASKVSNRLDDKTGESYNLNRRIHSDETLFIKDRNITGDTLKQDFHFIFPKTFSPDKNKLEIQNSSSEFIKDTQNMLLAKAEKERKKQEEEQIRKLEEQVVKKMALEEKKKELALIKANEEKRKRLEVLAQKDEEYDKERKGDTHKNDSAKIDEKEKIKGKEEETQIGIDKKATFITKSKEEKEEKQKARPIIIEGEAEKKSTKKNKDFMRKEVYAKDEIDKQNKQKAIMTRDSEYKNDTKLKGVTKAEKQRSTNITLPKEEINTDTKDKAKQNQTDKKSRDGLRSTEKLHDKEIVDTKLPTPTKMKETQKESEPKEIKKSLESKESKEQKEKLDPKTLEDSKELKEIQKTKQLEESESKGTKEQKEKLDPKTLKDSNELKEIQKTKQLEESESKGTKEQKEKLDPKILKDSKESKEIQKTKQLEESESKGTKEHKEKLDPKILKDSKESKEIQKTKQLEEPKELGKLKETKEIKEVKESKDAKESKEPKEPKQPKDLEKSKELKESKSSKEPTVDKHTHKADQDDKKLKKEIEGKLQKEEKEISKKEKDEQRRIEKENSEKEKEFNKKGKHDLPEETPKTIKQKKDDSVAKPKEIKDKTKPEKLVADVSSPVKVKMASVKVRRLSPDDLILRLVRLKQSVATPGRARDKYLSDMMLGKCVQKHQKPRTDAKVMCTASDIDFELELLDTSKIKKENTEVIIGDKIFLYKKPVQAIRHDALFKVKQNELRRQKLREFELQKKLKQEIEEAAAKKKRLEDKAKQEQIEAEKREKEGTGLSYMKNVDLNAIKVRRPSPDDLILQLVRIKQSTGVRAERNRPKRLAGTKIAKKEVKVHKQRKPSAHVLSRETESEPESERPDELKDDGKVAEIIIGPKISRYKPSMRDRLNATSAPSYVQSTFDTNQEPVRVKEVEPSVHVTGKEAEHELPKGVIRYALSDRAFIEKGWTMLPTEKVVRKMNVYRMRPAHPEFDWFVHNKNKGMMEYDSGEKLAEFDNEGRGRWFYRNGRMALDYYDAEELNAQQRFVIYSSGEPDERGRAQPYTLLATFDYLGNGVVFDHSGKIRLKYNQTEGVVLDRSIGPVSHWKWHTLNDPPVLQQVMIDTQMAHKDPSIIKLGGAIDDRVARPDNEDMLAIEFDNFIREKSKKLTQTFKPFQIKMKALKINENFSLRVLDQATVYLLFRDGTTNLKLNIGMVLDHKEIVDTDTAEVGEVSTNMERLPAKTDSLAGLQRSVAHAERYERLRTERELKIRPTMPRASADKLVSAASQPMRTPIRLRTGPSSTNITDTYCKCSRKPTSSNIYYDTRLC